MSIKVLFFASLADITGFRETEVDGGRYPDVETIFEEFSRLHPRLAQHRASVLFAVNSEFAKPGTAVHDGDEVAFFPPVSGG